MHGMVAFALPTLAITCPQNAIGEDLQRAK
jgi:hypothetical protein